MWGSVNALANSILELISLLDWDAMLLEMNVSL